MTSPDPFTQWADAAAPIVSADVHLSNMFEELDGRNPETAQDLYAATRILFRAACYDTTTQARTALQDIHMEICI